MRNSPSIIRRSLVALAAAVLLAGCGGTRADVEIVGMQNGVSRQQYLAMPGSARVEQAKDAEFGAKTQGVAVEVLLKIDGYKGSTLPLAYTLHDARNQLPFVSRKAPITPDSDQWSKRGHVWLPVLAPGSYYVQVVLGDSTGRKTNGPRTEDFTVQ
ncbi:hypothetical protein [Longimicrobium sp.]|uniref:hypothetical protein n=1 Tax=Longimicrobium sp. TaxID=2029185 RepID=UPI003B3ABD90